MSPGRPGAQGRAGRRDAHRHPGTARRAGVNCLCFAEWSAPETGLRHAPSGPATPWATRTAGVGEAGCGIIGIRFTDGVSSNASTIIWRADVASVSTGPARVRRRPPAHSTTAPAGPRTARYGLHSPRSSGETMSRVSEFQGEPGSSVRSFGPAPVPGRVPEHARIGARHRGQADRAANSLVSANRPVVSSRVAHWSVRVGGSGGGTRAMHVR